MVNSCITENEAEARLVVEAVAEAEQRVWSLPSKLVSPLNIEEMCNAIYARDIGTLEQTVGSGIKAKIRQ